MGYRYQESGLDNVVLEGFDPSATVQGEEGLLIPRIGRLHRVIAGALLAKAGPLNGRELRFLRAELGASVPDLAREVGVEMRVLCDAEADLARLDAAVEEALRRTIRDGLALSTSLGCTAAVSGSEPIRIDASDPSRYRLLETRPVS